MKQLKYIFVILCLISFMSSCTVFYPNKMLRTGSNYQYSDFPEELESEYKLAPNDKLSFVLYTKNGAQLINVALNSSMIGVGYNSSNRNSSDRSRSYGSGSSSRSRQNEGSNTFTIEFDGMVKLPIIRRVKLSGLTIREAEAYLEEVYSKYYKDPFAILTVENKRIYVFPGQEGAASVYNLQNDNTTLFEVLADIGGISDGRADKIKIIRGDLNNPEVYLIDLTTIDEMQKANLVMQANDILYIEPRYRISERINESIAPYLSIISTVTLIYTLFYTKNTN